MLRTAKKTLACAALCAASIGACAALASPAIAASVSTGATAAPSEEGAPAAPSTSSSGSPSSQEGISLATWFGPGLFGRHTACGQKLTKQLVGVANRTLPCGTLVDFSYRGKQVIAPVVDRGPYASNGANWDLTEGAARLLKMGGIVKLDAKIVGHVANSPELGLPAGHNSSHKSETPAVTSPTGGVEAG